MVPSKWRGNPQLRLPDELREPARNVLISLRDVKKIRKEEIGAAIGVNPYLVGRWMHYGQLPSRQNYKKLLKYYEGLGNPIR